MPWESAVNNATGNGLLIVISGPSGAGKGTLCRELLHRRPDVAYSVSATSRQPRAGEVEGKEYFFYSKEEMSGMIADGDLLEWAEYCGHYYGTPRSLVEKTILAGQDIILEIEIQGALKIKQTCPQAVFIFIVPPSLDTLAERIHRRGTETEEAIQARLEKALQELNYLSQYDYVIVNDEISVAVDKLVSIIAAEKCKILRKVFDFKEEA
ncbi:MAG: guanylate kinase [Peptococcaceae bacterium]|jgi:guanylate kinase|nr:guanylate kinase [Peptococcaceae bacterium]